MVRMLILIMAGLLLLAGCGSYWEDQGTAAVKSASARQAQAEAARQNAEAAIIEARAQGTLAESQAQALTQSVGAVVDLADDGEYVGAFAGIAFAVLAFAGWAIWTMARRPTGPPPVAEAPRQWITLETAEGPVRMIRQPQETPEQFIVRVALLAATLGAQERVLLEAPPRNKRR